MLLRNNHNDLNEVILIGKSDWSSQMCIANFAPENISRKKMLLLLTTLLEFDFFLTYRDAL